MQGSDPEQGPPRLLGGPVRHGFRLAGLVVQLLLTVGLLVWSLTTGTWSFAVIAGVLFVAALVLLVMATRRGPGERLR